MSDSKEDEELGPTITSTEHDTGSEENSCELTRAHDNSTENEMSVNNDRLVGRDAGSEHMDASAAKMNYGESEVVDSTVKSKEYTSAPMIESPSVLDLEMKISQKDNIDDAKDNANSDFGVDTDGSAFLQSSTEDNFAVAHSCQAEETSFEKDCLPGETESEFPTAQEALEIIVSNKETPDTEDELQECQESSSQGMETKETSKSVEKEKFNVESLSYELQVGYRILSNMMSASNRCVNKLFLYPVDDKFPETAAYYEKIKKPMWMFKMKEKFESHQYDDITEFMADFRLMIENCYRFNGPDNFVSKKAQKLETMMKQKVALLSKNLRDKIICAAAAEISDDDLLTSAGLRRRVRNPNAEVADPSQKLLSQLRKDRELQEKVDRRQKVEDRRAMEQARLQELQDWEDKLIGSIAKEHIRTMWELPQIGLFVYLCMESLGLEEEVTQYQLERGLALPRECTDFRRLMTCLLSTPHQRKNLKSFMPYQVWNVKLSEKLDYFYKVLSDKNGNHTQACYKLGLDLRAFKIMGKVNPMLKRKFHELSFLKRVWILKNYCDFCLETQQYLQKTIEDIEAVRPNDVREVLLGSDGRGYRYLNFPMFTGKDIRIFKHSKHSEPTLENLCMEDWSVDTEKPSASSSRCSTPINQRNVRPAETPSTSLRARALLQAAESKEASPFRDLSRAGSEAMDTNSPLPHQAPLEGLDNTQNKTSVKPAYPKKRKKTSIFTGKKKRLKTKKAGSGNCSVPSTVDVKTEEDSSVGNDSLNTSACEQAETAAPESVHKDVTSNGDLPSSSCDTVQIPAKSDISSYPIGSNSTACTDETPTSAKQVPSNKDVEMGASLSREVGASVSRTQAVSEESPSCDVEKSVPGDNCENSYPSQKVLEDKHPDSAYLSCESDKSGRDEEELGSTHSSEPQGKPCQPSKSPLLPNGDGNQLCTPSHIKKETKDDIAEVKQEVLDENMLSETVKSETEDLVKMDCSESDASPGKLESPVDKREAVETKLVGKRDESEHNVAVDKGMKTLSPKFEDIKKENEAQCSSPPHENWTSQDKTSILQSEAVSNGWCTEKSSISHEKMDASSSVDEGSIKEAGVNGSKEKQGVCSDAEETTQQKEEAAENGDSGGEATKEEEEEESDEDEDDLPDRGRLELVAESMEELRQLMNKLSNPEPIKRGKKVYAGVMKPCEEELVANLSRFHEELLKYEKSLVNARAGMQTKLRKEVDSYVEPKLEESKGWDSDHSQSTKDSSDEEEEEEEENEEQPEAETGRKSKRIKAKQQVAATTSLLTSAASKLSAITDNGTTNEDSNESFELDISSRGRLRKRRVIPNNTEDTGLKKRKLADAVMGGEGTLATSSAAAVVVSSVSASQPASLPTVIQRQAGKPWPSHILSMLTSGGLAAVPSSSSSSPLRPTVPSASQLLAGQVLRLVTPGADGAVRTLHVSGSLAAGRGVHAAMPGSVIISPQNLASIRFVSSTGVLTLPRERVLSASTANSSSSSLSSSSPAQASHPVIQQLLLNQSKSPARGQVPPSSKAPFKPSVSTTVNGSLLPGQTVHQAAATTNSSSVKMSLVVTLPSSTPGVPVQHGSSVGRSGMVRPPVVMVTPQAATRPGVSAAPVVVSQVSSTVSGGKQVLDLGSLSVSQIQQLMRNQAIQINMGGAGSGPTTLLLTTGLQQLTASTGAPAGTGLPRGLVTSAAPRLQQQQKQQMLRPSVVATGESSLLAMMNNKGPRLVTVSASAATISTTSVLTSSAARPGQGALQGTVQPQQVNLPLATKGGATAMSTSNSALKSVLNNRNSLPQSTLGVKVSGGVPAAGSQAVRGSPLMPRIISSMSPAATAVASALPTNLKVAGVTSSTGEKDMQQKAPRIITVPLVHLSPSKKYASNVTVKALLENRAPRRTDAEDGAKSAGIVAGSSPSTPLVSKIGETMPGSDKLSEDNASFSSSSLPSTTQALITSLTMPLSVSTGGPSALECATSEVIVPTVHIKVPSPNTLPSVLHNKNGTTIVQSTKVPIAMASEAKAPETMSPSVTAGQSCSIPSISSMVQPQCVKAANVVPAPPASIATTMVVQTSSAALPGAGLSRQLNQQNLQKKGIKNVMLKVTPQSGSSGQFVQGFMTSRGLVIPQSALLQQQGKNVILANANQNGLPGALPAQQAQISTSIPLQQAQISSSLPIQQAGLSVIGQPGATILTRPQAPNQIQPQQQLQQLTGVGVPSCASAPAVSSQIQKGQVINSGGMKLMLVNPAGQGAATLPGVQQATSVGTNLLQQPALAAVQQPQTSTPAAELVKQIAANSAHVQPNSQAGLLSPSAISALGPKVVQKSGVVVGAPTQLGMVRMSAPVVVSSGSPSVTSTALQQMAAASGTVLSGQTVINSSISPSSISPQLAAQILALQQQQQQQQQQQGVILDGGKNIGVAQQQQQHQTRPGAPSVVTLQLQQLGQLFSSLSQLQPGGVQQQQPAAVSVAGGQPQQQAGQIVQLATMNPGQTLMAGSVAPQTQQLVKLASGQVSPQIQLAPGQLQTSQAGGLVLQQQQQAGQLPSQGVLMSQKASVNLQQTGGPLQALLGQQQQQQLIRLPTQPAQPMAGMTLKPQVSPPSSALQNGGAITSQSSTPLVSLPLSQGFVVSPAASVPLPGNQQQQQQVQFLLNSSPLASLPMAAGGSLVTPLSKLPGGNVRRVIRADSSLLPTSVAGSVQTQAGNVVLGGSSTGQLALGTKQVILPSSGSSAAGGQFLISPMKLGASPQANIISPLKLLGGLQMASSAAPVGGQGTQILMNSSQLPGAVVGKPSVIYASQPNPAQAVVEKTDSKMAQILLSQSNGSLVQLASPVHGNKDDSMSSVTPNNQGQQLLIKSGGPVVQPSPGGNGEGPKTTFLYKVGEQYFSPAAAVSLSGSQLGSVNTTLQSIPPSSSLTTPAAVSKPDVQLLVPPACIEASNKMLHLNSGSVGTAPTHNKSQQISASSVAVNGVQASTGTHFSFSLSGPVAMSKPHTDKPAETTSGSHITNGQARSPSLPPPPPLKQGRKEEVAKQPPGITFAGGDTASTSGPQHQQALCGATGDEEEAALNLLTLANQAV